MRQLPHLTLNDGSGFLLNGVLAFLELKQLHGVEDGGKRVAKFMAEHSQKFIFAAVGFLERMVELGILHDHGGSAREFLRQS